MQTIRLMIAAVGGQGNLLASKVLGEAALLGGISMQKSEIHGMAQRGGVVESAMVFGDALSPTISESEADVLVGFEPAETLRALKHCNASSVVVSNLRPVLPFTVAIGRCTYPNLNQLKGMIRSKVKQLIAFDAMSAARQAGHVMSLNMVLLGALMQTEILPINARQVREAIHIRTKPRFTDINLKAFDLGFEAARQTNSQHSG